MDAAKGMHARLAMLLPSESDTLPCEPLDELCDGCLREWREPKLGLKPSAPLACLRFELDESCELDAC